MIRLGRYDVFDKWEIVCRSWAGGEAAAIDVGVNRHGNRKLLPDWQFAAFAGGNRYCANYARLKCESLDSEMSGSAIGNDDDAGVDAEFSRLLREIGPGEFRDRTGRLIDSIKCSGMAAPCAELPPRIASRLKEMFKLGALQALRWTEDPGEIPDIDVLRADVRPPFPRAAIKGKRNVLAMFCVRYYGVLDVIHINDVCPDRVTLVDVDEECLGTAQRIYPGDWTYICSDYKEFLARAEEQGLVYDLIVADPWRLQCPEVGFDMLPTIMARCSDMFVMHYVKEMFEELGVAQTDFAGLSRALRQRTGVELVVTEMVERSTENCWLVLRKPEAVASETGTQLDAIAE